MSEPDPDLSSGRDPAPRDAATSPTHAVRDLVEVAPDVWVATAEIWTTTSTVVVGRGGETLVVDPAVTVAEVDALAESVRVRGWRVTAGFATHPHWDHVLWSRAWGDARRWATARAAQTARRRATELVDAAEAAAPGHDPGLVGALTPLPRGATRLPWPVGTECDPGAVRVVEHDAHAPGHAAVLVRGVLLAGDMLSDVEVPLVDTGSRFPVRTYRGALGALELAAREADVLVPGHGTPAVGRDAVAERFAADHAYLDALEAAVGRDGVTVEDPRLAGYVATWHDGQLVALRER